MMLLLLMVFLPFLLIIPLFLISEKKAFDLSLLSSAIIFILSLLAAYIGLSQGFGQLSVQLGYIQALGIDLSLELNKYSNILMIMTSLVLLATAIVAKRFIKESRRMYNMLFLLISGSALGVFLAGNLFFFYIFWELSDVSMFFIIYVFGGYDRRYAAIKYIIYSIIASLFLLTGMMVIYSGVPSHTFSIEGIILQSSSIPQSIQLLALILLLTACLIKMPSFPFHSWLPDSATEAPTTGSMVLAGILLKFGGYGMLLMFLMLPIASTYASYMAALLGFSAVYGAFVAMRQSNLKKVIAYTSMIEMGIASLGIASMNTFGIAGGLYVMLNNGLIVPFLFLIVGAVDESYKTLLIARLSGIVKNFPFVTYALLFGVFAFIGIPLTSGFIGYLLVFIGAVSAYGTLAFVPLAAILLIGAFLFLILERAFFNSSKAVEPFSNPEMEISYAAVLLSASTIFLGILPFLLLSPFALS